MKKQTEPTITWKSSMSAKDYLCVKEYEFYKERSDERAINWKYKMEK